MPKCAPPKCRTLLSCFSCETSIDKTTFINANFFRCCYTFILRRHQSTYSLHGEEMQNTIMLLQLNINATTDVYKSGRFTMKYRYHMEEPTLTNKEKPRISFFIAIPKERVPKS